MSHENKSILVTGGAGFLGSHLVEKLLASKFKITFLDNFDPFYPREIKERNIDSFVNNPSVTFLEIDILEIEELEKIKTDFFAIIHLAAKAGVRPSIENPIAYQDVNVKGTQNLLEFARKRSIKQFVFASSSSVYGINKNLPWSESDFVLNPISPYASTKLSGELLGHVYSHLFGIRFIGLRFFTVFGPRQRPDLAIHLFTKKILNNESIKVFGDGNTRRDYTYVDDIVSGIMGALLYSDSMFEIFNLGNSETITLSELIDTIENVLERKAKIERLPEQPGDVPATYANIKKAQSLLNYTPQTSLKEGLIKFKDWYLHKL